MNRTYLSGSKKRKLADEKKERENAVLSKVPKINQMFASAPSTSTSTSSAVNDSVIENRSSEIDLAESHTDSIVENDKYEDLIANMSASTSVGDDLNTSLVDVSSDPGLWSIPEDTKSLQKNWLMKGKIHFRRYSHFDSKSFFVVF